MWKHSWLGLAALAVMQPSAAQPPTRDHAPSAAADGPTTRCILDAAQFHGVNPWLPWHLARQIRRHGNTWFGVASYHSTSPCHNARYASLLWNTLLSWNAVAGARVAVASASTCSGAAPGAYGTARAARVAAPALAFEAAP